MYTNLESLDENEDENVRFLLPTVTTVQCGANWWMRRIYRAFHVGQRALSASITITIQRKKSVLLEDTCHWLVGSDRHPLVLTHCVDCMP